MFACLADPRPTVSHAAAGYTGRPGKGMIYTGSTNATNGAGKALKSDVPALKRCLPHQHLLLIPTMGLIEFLGLLSSVFWPSAKQSHKMTRYPIQTSVTVAAPILPGRPRSAAALLSPRSSRELWRPNTCSTAANLIDV